VSVRVQLPPLLRPLCGGSRELAAEGHSISEVVADLARTHPPFARHLLDEAGGIRTSIVFLHDGALVRAGEADAHKVRDGDEIVLTNALSGG
jgi:molybdopterin converting factor small subunit